MLLPLVPSTYEPFGMVAAEALAAGRPVVASDVGGLREIVKHGETGYLFRAGDHRELARYLVSLLEDGGLRRAMGENGRRDAMRFDAREIALRYIGVYLKAMM